jgi:Uma2 family endonuclease
MNVTSKKRRTMAVHLQHYRFSLEAYEAMVAHGVLPEDDRVELLRGAIVTMSPIGTRHAASVRRLHTMFATLFSQSALVSVQSPIALPPDSEPQPDVVLLRTRSDFYERAHPRPSDVLLVVEVSDSTIEIDRDIKLPLYGESGVAEVWIVNLVENVIEVYLRPSDGTYSTRRVYRTGEEIAISTVAGPAIAVASILPTP